MAAQPVAERVRRYREREKFKEHVSELLLSLQNSSIRPGVSLERACFATVRGALIPGQWRSTDNYVSDRYPDDDITHIVLRSAVNPSMTTDSTMAAILMEVVADFVASLAPMSAVAPLFASAVQVNLNGLHTVRVPHRLGPININDVPWIAEGGAIPVPSIPLAADITLGPMKKMAAIIPFTRELAESGNAEQIFTTLLRETAARQLDSTVFSNQPATAARPAGILDGVTPLTATAGGGDTAMTGDLAALANAIGTVTTGLAYIAHPNQANSIRLRKGALWPADIPVWPTLGVAPGTVIALDPSALMTAFGPNPEFSTSKHTMVQLQTTPTNDPLAGAPTRSLFQTDSVGLRLLLDAAYLWRMAGAVAWVNNATW
jgi:hypothetical protein